MQPPTEPNFCELVYDLIYWVPAGKFTTYKDLAVNLGYPNQARQVAKCLSSLARQQQGAAYADLPWHRVMRSDCRLAFPYNSPAYKRQEQLLLAEGLVPQPTKKVHQSESVKLKAPRFPARLRYSYQA